MATTHKLIATVTVGTATASIGFTAIPGTYTDLLVKLSARSAASTNIVDDASMQINGSTSNFSSVRLFRDGTTNYGDVGGARDFAQTPNSSTGANIFGVAEFYITNYAKSGLDYKVISAESLSDNNITSSSGSIYYGFFAGLMWSNSAAITSLTFTNGSGQNWVAGTTAYLYGISNA